MSSASNRYSVELSGLAAKNLAKLESSVQLRVRLAINLLAENPRPPKSKKLSGKQGYRVRVGQMRILYEIFDKRLVVVVVRIGHRREVYKDL